MQPTRDAAVITRARLGLAVLLAVALSLSIAAWPSRGWAATAEYTITFDATWSAATHPTNFPIAAHFSTLIGGTHDDSIVFWEAGGNATPGIEAMAETGEASTFGGEVDDAIGAGSAAGKVGGGGIGMSPGSTELTFDVWSSHPLITLVTMVAPSPDWFVGVGGLALFEDGSFLDEVIVDVYAYDAGTDSGVSFTSSNADTVPQEPIAQITGFPFTNAPPLGTFTFTLVPEPSSYALGATALAALARCRRRRARP